MNFKKDIELNRFYDFTINFKPVYAKKKVSVVLNKHKFLFGCNIFGLIRGVDKDKIPLYKERFLALFNTGVLPFYWGSYEPREGEYMEKETLKAAKWCKSHGLVLKGHPLCWHTVCADWLLKYETQVIMEKQLARINREVLAFKDFINIWDVINEVVIMPIFDRYDNAVTRLAKTYGHEELTIKCFKEAKKNNPDTILLINDFDHSKKYEQLIENLLEKGCPIDAIGIQTHQHQGYRGVEYFAKLLERFSRFGLPLHFTEITILSGELVPKNIDDLNDAERKDWPSTDEGESNQAEEVSEMYSQLYAHPSVEAIIWWDMKDGNWLNAPSGLIRRDLSEKPSYKKIKKFIHEQWGFQKQDINIDSQGNLKIHGPEGEYQIYLPDNKEKIIQLNKSQKSIQITEI